MSENEKIASPPSIMAPAGNKAAFLAAVAAGADAIYCGLKVFSARMEAKNFSPEELQPLVELLRIRYVPGKHEYYFKHVYRDLPGEVVSQLEDLVKIKNIEDIRQGVAKASEMFEANLEEVEKNLATRHDILSSPGHDDGINL